VFKLGEPGKRGNSNLCRKKGISFSIIEPFIAKLRKFKRWRQRRLRKKMRTAIRLERSVWLILIVVLGVCPVTFLSSACGGGSSSSGSTGGGGGGGGGGDGGTGGGGGGGGGAGGQAIPATFFAMTIPAGGADYPTVSVGALGHPSTLAWGFIEENQGTYNFTGFDGYVNAAVQHGLVDSSGAAEVTITFGYTPPWAAADMSGCTSVGGREVCPSPPANMSSWTDFVTAVVNHYNGTTAPHVKYYELWNEFSSPTFWTGSVQDMVNLAAAAYPIVHTDPYSILLTPSISGPVKVSGNGLPDGLTFMTSYLQAGGNKYADGGSFHGYVAAFGGQNVTLFPFPEQDSTSGCASGSACFGSIITKETGFRQVFDQNGLSGKPMFDTEGSWGMNSNLPDSNEQVAWVARWFILQADYYPSITQASWYAWGYPSDSGQLESSTGAPNQAGTAYNQVYNWLVGASFSSQCASDSNSTWTCPITRSGGYQGLIVWNTNGNFSYSPASTYTQYRNLAGNTTKLSGGAITIGIQPVLFENQSP
jgi:hypothetical protein